MNIASILSEKSKSCHYLNRYVALIEKWKDQELSEYYERHHICPKAQYPQFSDGRRYPWNIIRLTARQHFIAHWLLWKILRDRDSASAFKIMFLGGNAFQRDRRINHRQASGKVFEVARKEASSKGIPKTDAHKRKISEAHKGKRLSDETRNRISIAQSNRSQEHRDKIGLAHRGKTISQEMRQKQSDALSGNNNPRALEWEIHFDNGTVIKIDCLKTWCKDNNFKYTTVYMRGIKRDPTYRNGFRLNRF